MKKQLLLAAIGLFILPLTVLRVGASQASAGTTVKGSYLPNLTYDFTDLEIRDSHNNILQPSASETNLTELFMSNLFDLTVKIEAHGMRDLWGGINYFSDLFKKSFLTCLVSIMGAIQEALEPTQKRFVHNVQNLWITPFVGILMLFMVLRFSQNRSACLPVILRC